MMDDTGTSGRMKKRRAGPADVEIGRKIRALRLERGLPQTDLADAIGLTFQQVQKYEKGTNRVSAGRLVHIAGKLNTPIMFFYGSAKPEICTCCARGVLEQPETQLVGGQSRGVTCAQ